MVAALGAAGASPAEPPRTVLFVCEHGSAKSVVAAAHFNRLAEARGIATRAISRGLTPDAELAPAARSGLERDGLPTSDVSPRALEPADLAAAERVIVFSELPERFAPPRAVERWEVPAVSEDYEAARDALVERIRKLVDEVAVEEMVAEQTVAKEFVVVRATESLPESIAMGQSIAASLGLTFDLRGLEEAESGEPSLSREVCEENGWEYPCYVQRGRYDDGIYLSLEPASTFAPGAARGYVVVLASAVPGDRRLDAAFEKARAAGLEPERLQRDAYLGCMH